MPTLFKHYVNSQHEKILSPCIQRRGVQYSTTAPRSQIAKTGKIGSKSPRKTAGKASAELFISAHEQRNGHPHMTKAAKARTEPEIDGCIAFDCRSLIFHRQALLVLTCLLLPVGIHS